MDVLKSQVIPDWRIPRNPLWFAVRMLLHFCVIVAVFELTFPGRRAWLWLLTVAYYWFFYARMIRFAVWTSDTLRLIQRASEFSPVAQLRKLAKLADWPDFIVLIPAFGAGRCIQTVAAILAEQDYPAGRWNAIFVSDEPELAAAAERAEEAAMAIQNAVRARSAPKSLPVAEGCSRALSRRQRGRAIRRLSDAVRSLSPPDRRSVGGPTHPSDCTWLRSTRGHARDRA